MESKSCSWRVNDGLLETSVFELVGGMWRFDEGTDFTAGSLDRFDGEEESRHGGQVCISRSWF